MKPLESRVVLTAGFLVGCVVAPAATHADVVIHEIHYHPSNAGLLPGEDAEGLQFLELLNTGALPVDISGWSFNPGVVFTFPGGTILPANGVVVVASDPTLLRTRVPGLPSEVPVLQWAPGSDLSNGGELVRLLDAFSVIVDEVTYDDTGLWPSAADGSGPSLELINPSYDNAYPLVWKASLVTNGTPGMANGTFTAGPAVLWEDPPRWSLVPVLSAVRVMFAEAVTGVAPASLSVGGSPATVVTGSGAGPYDFTGFAAPTEATVSAILGPGAIQDLEAHPFAGDTWIYSLSAPRVVINEIHYNPNNAPAWPDDDGEEYIEIVNGDSVPVDIGGWRLTEFASPGVTFPGGTILQPGEYLVVAKDPSTLQARTGCSAAFTWGVNDSLSNGGEPVALRDAVGILVDRVYYSDDPPWPGAPDGTPSAPSLERINPAAGTPCTAVNQSDCTWQAAVWSASASANGSCGAPNTVLTSAPVVSSTDPARGALITGLTQVSVTFSESVTGVTAADLEVDGVGADEVTGSGAGPYIFLVDAPASGTHAIVLRGDGGIQDLQSVPFAGDTWQYLIGLPKVVINEIHYHPADEAVGEGKNPEDLQFLELINHDTTTADLSGYSLSAGLTFRLPAGTSIAPGEFLVLAKNSAFLQSTLTIPAGVPVLQWTSGDLANGGETVALSDPFGHTIDTVTYDDGGRWSSVPDGTGPSLELVNPALLNEYGAAWASSLASNGTPGAPNSRYVAAPPPIIDDVRHYPPLPGAEEPVTITAFVLDEGAVPTVTLHHRRDQVPTVDYAAVAMFDDGLHGDGPAGDNVYGAVLPGLAEGQRLDFAIQASDGTSASVAPIGHDGVFPGGDGHPPRVYLCKFSSAPLPTDFPSYHLITTQHTRDLQATRDKTEYDATFIRCPASSVPSQCEVFYNVVERYRGATTLFQDPPSYRIELPGDQPMDSEMGFEIQSLNMLAQQAARQSLGYDLFEAAGLLAPKHQLVRFNTNPLADGGTQNAVYSNVEVIDEDFFTSQNGDLLPLRFPKRCNVHGTTCGGDLDCTPGESCIATDGGNAYRGRSNDASLRWEGFDPDAYRVDANDRHGYEKATNEDADDWTDLITLCDAMNCRAADGGLLCREDTYDGWFQENLGSYADVEQWARWFAVHILLNNAEGGIYRDTGDDYFLYFWPAPGYNHATFLPWDMDAIIPAFHETIWRTGYSNPNWPVRRMLRNNAYAGLFVGAICEYMDTVFAQAAMDARIEALPDALFPTGTPQGNGPQTKQGMKDWTVAHRSSINGEIRRRTTLEGVPASPYTSPHPAISLSGQLNQCWAREVRVNGTPANYRIANPDGVGADWSYNFVLTPGINRITVQTVDHTGNEIDRVEDEVFYDPPGAQYNSLRLTLPRRMYGQKTMTIAADIIDVAGRIDWEVWEAVGTVSVVRLPGRSPVPITTTSFDPHITDPNGAIRFYNGRGTVSFTLNEGAAAPAGTYELTVSVEGMTATREFTVLSAPAFRTLSGTLSGANLIWGPDEQIHLTGSVVVPAGSTLAINPGTLIMVDPGAFQNGTSIVVYGALSAVGAQDNPIFFFPTAGAPALRLTQSGSASNANCWRGIDLHGTGSSTIEWVFLTGAGNGTVVSHPRPPIIATRDRHTISADHCFFIDNNGMIFSAVAPGRFTVRNSLFQRAGIGAEFQSDGNYLLLEDSYFARIGHAPEESSLDGDLLHIDGASSKQTIRRCIFNDGGDDGIDHTAAVFTVEDVIIHNMRDKCISMTGGRAHLKNFLCFGSGLGVRGTVDGEHVTINVPGPVTAAGAPGLTESIIWPESICSPYISYTDLGKPADAACGSNNLSADPLFLGSRDFNLQPGSPALTAGRDGTRIGWLGFPYAATCDSDSECDDGNECTFDRCVDRECTFTPIANCAPCWSDAQCDDVNPCTDDACDLGTCRHVATSGSCDDGNACTSGDQCSAGLCSGGSVSCDDSSACTSDSCDVATGCIFAPIACSDGNPCTDDSCDSGTGCTYTDDDSNACTDSVSCTDDVCRGGSCVSMSNCPAGQTCNQAADECGVWPQALTFQQGVGGYSGAVDTYIGAALGSQATTASLIADGGPEHHALLRFDGIFGPGEAQIPQGSTIVDATLTLRVGSGGNDPRVSPVYFHRLLHPWVDADTWSKYGTPPWNTEAGVQADGVDAEATPDASAVMSTAGTAYPVSVTESVQAWASDAGSQHGWVILASGDDGLRVYSAEAITLAYRPSLTVTYRPPRPLVSGVLVDGVSPTTLAWESQGAGAVYDLVSGSLKGLIRDQGVASATCLADDVPTAEYIDPRPAPPVGDGYYYLVRPATTGSSGSYGYATSGDERIPALDCP